jgi:copper chaperone CopZ
VQAALETVEGVEVVEIDYDAKTATVTCPSDCDSEALIAALEEGGYGGTVKK